MKFVDGLANVAGTGPDAAVGVGSSSFRSISANRAQQQTPMLSCTGSDDPHDLLAEILAVQQSQKRFRHTFDPIEHILFETNFSATLPFRETSERLISSVPPVKHQKTVDAGA